MGEGDLFKQVWKDVHLGSVVITLNSKGAGWIRTVVTSPFGAVDKLNLTER